MRFRTGVGLLAVMLAGAALAAPAPASAETVTKADSVAAGAPPQMTVQLTAATYLQVPSMAALRALALDTVKVQDAGSPVALSLRSVTAIHAQTNHAQASPGAENRTRLSTVDSMPAMSVMLSRSEPLARQRTAARMPAPVSSSLLSAQSNASSWRTAPVRLQL